MIWMMDACLLVTPVFSLTCNSMSPAPPSLNVFSFNNRVLSLTQLQPSLKYKPEHSEGEIWQEVARGGQAGNVAPSGMYHGMVAGGCSLLKTVMSMGKIIIT